MTGQAMPASASLPTLQRASKRMGEDPDPRWHPVALWVHQAALDCWAHGEPCPIACMDCDDDLLASHLRKALVVARAYLGETR